MIPNLRLHLLPERTHDFCIRSAFALVVDEEEPVRLRLQRIHAWLARPRHAAAAKRGAGALEQVPLPGLVVTEGKPADERLEDEPDKPGHERVRLHAPVHIPCVDRAGPRVDEGDARVVGGQPFEGRRLHCPVVHEGLPGTVVPLPLQLPVGHVYAGRALEPAGPDADDTRRVGCAQERKQQQHEEHARVVLEGADNLVALRGLDARAERRVARAEEQQVDARLPRLDDVLAHPAHVREQRDLAFDPDDLGVGVERAQLRDELACALRGAARPMR